ncbi:hypothetical protein [Sphingopyxis granuli]|uniref:hypothetical protein n=1 Tax=Sphingopyxis granuli TaxID=267128 RepID=UPI0008363C46|nr:hypothetical protein [Sphingopyxis granuli]
MAIKSATQTETSVAAITVADLLSDLDIPDEIGAAPYTGSQQQLVSITRWLAMQFGKELLYTLKQPTPSALVKECKKMFAKWWDYLTDRVEVADDLKKVIFYNFRDAFEHTTHKMLTGYDLPKTKDGFQHNALRGLRKATGHGDAALLLYRIRYWWPKATVVQCGKKWIAKTHKQWADELGISPRTYRTAQDRLLERGLIETITAEFKGHSMLHLRPTPEAVALFQHEVAGEV